MAVARWVSASYALEGPRIRPRLATEAESEAAERDAAAERSEMLDALAYGAADPGEIVTGTDISALIAELITPPAWMAAAACKGMPPETFFPGRGDDQEPAKEVCRTCPVRAACLDHALDLDLSPHGVWGGLSAVQRREMHRSRTLGAIGEAAAGTSTMVDTIIATRPKRPRLAPCCAACGVEVPAKRRGSQWCSRECASSTARKRRMAG